MEQPEAQLARRAAEGDEHAFRMLVNGHAPRVYQVCLRITGDAHRAEDAMQEAFLSAHKALGAFEERSRFSTWLHRIAVNAALQLVRRERTWDERRAQPMPMADNVALDPLDTVAADGVADPEREVASELAGEATARALHQLSGLERLAFVLRHFEQMAVREVAEQLAISESSVKQAVLRAVRKLRVSLADHQELASHA
ncbi:MAG: sigma-70 family RNA polymerase sigma factor [Pseudomonadota bacterium]